MAVSCDMALRLYLTLRPHEHRVMQGAAAAYRPSMPDEISTGERMHTAQPILAGSFCRGDVS